MAVSERTRTQLVEYAAQEWAERSWEAGATRAIEREGYEHGRLQSAMRAIVEKLKRLGGDGMARNDLRSSLSTGHRQFFDPSIRKLAEDGVIVVVKVRNGERYRLTGARQGGDVRQGIPSQFNGGGGELQGGAPDNLVSLENHRSQKKVEKKLSCQKWFDQHIGTLVEAGHTTVESFAVYEAGRAAGYDHNSLYVAKSNRPDIEVVQRHGRKGNTWSLANVA